QGTKTVDQRSHASLAGVCGKPGNQLTSQCIQVPVAETRAMNTKYCRALNQNSASRAISSSPHRLASSASGNCATPFLLACDCSMGRVKRATATSIAASPALVSTDPCGEPLPT